MKKFEIEPIPEEKHASTEGVYYVTVDGDPVICLSDSEAHAVLPLNYSQQQGYLLRTLDPERLERFEKALEEKRFSRTRIFRRSAAVNLWTAIRLSMVL